MNWTRSRAASLEDDVLEIRDACYCVTMNNDSHVSLLTTPSPFSCRFHCLLKPIFVIVFHSLPFFFLRHSLYSFLLPNNRTRRWPIVLILLLFLFLVFDFDSFFSYHLYIACSGAGLPSFLVRF